MKNLILLFPFVFCSLLFTLGSAQTQFQRSSGGTGFDGAFSIIQSTDDGYAVAGHTGSFGAGYFDICILKLDANGTLQWSKVIGGPGFEYVFSIIQTIDGGYAVAGSTESFGAGHLDLYVVKLDASGTLQWNRTIGGTNYEEGNSIIQTPDGGYVVAGYTGSFGAGNEDIYIVKLDASGTLQWSKTIGGAATEVAYSIIRTVDGGYSVAGFTTSFGAGSNDMYIIKLDANGTFQWNRTVGGTGNDQARSIIQTTDGGYIVGGFTDSFGAGSGDMYFIKLDANGTLQWSRTIGGQDSDGGYSIVRTADSGIAAVGGTWSFGPGSGDIYVVKLNASGTLQWSKALGGTNSDFAASITQTADGGYALAGYTRSFATGQYDMYIIKLDAGANTCGQTISPASISGSGGILGNPTPSITTPNSSVTSPSPTIGTGVTVTTVCVIGIQPISNEIPASFQLYQNFPNPFNPITRIRLDIPSVEKIHESSLRIYNALGKEIETLVNENLQPGPYDIQWDASRYPSGVYFYKLISGDFSETKKMVLFK